MLSNNNTNVSNSNNQSFTSFFASTGDVSGLNHTYMNFIFNSHYIYKPNIN